MTFILIGKDEASLGLSWMTFPAPAEPPIGGGRLKAVAGLQVERWIERTKTPEGEFKIRPKRVRLTGIVRLRSGQELHWSKTRSLELQAEIAERVAIVLKECKERGIEVVR